MLPTGQADIVRPGCRADLDSLADNSQMNEVLQGLDGLGDVRAYFNISSLISSTMDTAPSDKRTQTEKIIRAL